MTSSSITNLVDVSMAKVVQINMKHFKCATDNLAVLLREEDIDLAIIQEPWVHSSCVKGLNINGYNLFYEKGQASCPRSYAKKCRPPWWNEKLSLLRRNARRAFNESYRTKVWTPYKDDLRVRKSKKLSWESHCQQIESIKESTGLAKLLANGHSCPSLLNKVDGNPVKSLMESPSLLVDTHFPGSSGDPPKVLPYRSANSGETIQSVVSSRRIKWAIYFFSPYKSPDPDGVLPIMLQSLGDVAVNWLSTIFCSCFSLNHVPSGWRQVRVVFIPKAGRTGHSTAKDYRPISLTSFLLKTMERLIDAYIRSLHSFAKISRAQHAYFKGKSTETALHEVVTVVEKFLGCKQFTLAAFLDIEGAFNNVSVVAI
ncbi:uncharacterized protein LOC119675512 [Teleopsis dalmanni]|uniref:uncharacterized protein LOC119675512 n=1 Tax=Teleopsis dalmanni TaxID=139649 RepID=UPI0018CDF86A|nr:uncharacterized protein LOC119675512 [Teleopsis dalmanni]